jgi:hypothetical protein
MVKRSRREDGGTVTVDNTPQEKPVDLAARLAAAATEARRREAAAAIAEYRGIVHGLADGREPDGETLAAIGDLSGKLRLPPDALSRSVAALQEERRLRANLEEVRVKQAEIKAAEPRLAAEIRAAEKKLLELREQLAEYHAIASSYPWAFRAVAEVKAENPLVFGELEHVAARFVAADGAMGTATLKSLVPREWKAEGHVARWGG